MTLWIMGLSINDSVYSCLFFFLTGLHFFHLLVGLFLCCLFFYNCSFSISYFLNFYFHSTLCSDLLWKVTSINFFFHYWSSSQHFMLSLHSFLSFLFSILLLISCISFSLTSYTFEVRSQIMGKTAGSQR